jgi:hypothetical protein
MLANFRKSFHPTEEEKLEQKKWLEEHSLKKKSEINFVKTHNGIYVSNPFTSGFDEDCESGCDNYLKNYPYFIEGGWCKLHKCNCGYGFTCDDFERKVK